MNRTISSVGSVLCLGAHPDDIEIGCGGSLLQLLAANPDVQVHWVVFSGDDVRRQEAFEAAQRFLGPGGHDVRVLDYPDTQFPRFRPEIKQAFGRLGKDLDPDLIFTHRTEDSHQDHRVLAELTWQTFRNHWILEYEIPKYEGDLGRPNVFVPLAAEDLEKKTHLLATSFETQQDKPWYRTETFRGLAAIRGLECRSDSGFAEAFYAPKTAIRFEVSSQGEGIQTGVNRRADRRSRVQTPRLKNPLSSSSGIKSG